MRRTRHQRGYLYRKGRNWCLRYYDIVQGPDGAVRRPQRSRVLAEASGPNRTKKAAQLLADEFLKPLNDGTITPASGMTLQEFGEKSYLPHVEQQKRPSTYNGYLKMWKRYLRTRSDRPLREYRTVDCEGMLAEIAHEYELSTRTLSHVKNMLSGMFRYASRIGVVNTPNPVRDVCVPQGKSSADTYAYGLDEITRMLAVLPQPARTVVAVAAFTGLRRGELRGLQLSDYDGEVLMVRRSVWRGHIGAPKGKRGVGAVPVIATLGKLLGEYLASHQSKIFLFESLLGRPASVEYMAREIIKPVLKKAGVDWHGWHAFRRGLATNLHKLGVSDIVIQAILRHSNVSVTRESYIKRTGVDQRSIAAMEALESLICTQHAPETEVKSRPVVVQ